MTHLTVKKIKGRHYLYVQWSWREGGRVRTDNLYIAPVDPETGEIAAPDGKSPQEVYAETREAFLNGLQNAPPSTAASPRPLRSTPPPDMPPMEALEQARTKSLNLPKSSVDLSLPLRVQLDFDRLKISRASLERQVRNHEQILNAAGLDIKQSPRIVMRHGLRHRVRFFARQNVIAVSVGRFGKGTANRARANFRRALADAKLHTLKTQKPDVYAALTLHAQTTQKDTLRELRKYLMNGNGRGRIGKALAVKLFGVIDPIRTGRSGTLSAAHLGLPAYGNRSDAIEDTALLLAEIEAHQGGYRGALTATKAELRKAQAAVTRAKGQGFSLSKLAKGERMSWGYRRRREIRRAEARAALQQIRAERLNQLRLAFRL